MAQKRKTPVKTAAKKAPTKKAVPKKAPAKKTVPVKAAKVKPKVKSPRKRLPKVDAAKQPEPTPVPPPAYVPEPEPAPIKAKDKFVPSPQQAVIFDWVKKDTGNAFIEAVAGAGKTTTLVKALQFMRGDVAFTAYNKKIAQEIAERTLDLRMSTLKVGTFHSFGFSAWRKIYRSIRVDEKLKKENMLFQTETPERLHSIVARLVSLGKQSGVYKLWSPHNEEAWLNIIEHHDIDADLEDPRDINLLIHYAMQGAIWSRKNCDRVIDFDDMIWLPAISDCKMDQYDWVLVDEAQDTNPARRLLASKMLKLGGRIVMVGDRYQAIYGFTGADNDAVDIIIREFQCKQLPLTVTYRCPKTVVAEAKKLVPHIMAHETAPEGSVRYVNALDFLEKEVPILSPAHAILCRKTKPLIELAFNLIRRRVPCHVEGRDIGQGLMKLASRWAVKSVDKLHERLEAYLDREIEKMMAKGREASIEYLRDRVETLYVLMEGCQTVDEVIRKINDMFQDTNGAHKTTVTLSTVHKAKGREWTRVYILGWREYMPAKWAKQSWEKEQERNLQYVAVTRSKGELVFLESLEEYFKSMQTQGEKADAQGKS